MDFRTTSLGDLMAMLADGEVSAHEVVQHSLSRIEDLDGQIGAFVAVDADAALTEAARIDDARAAGEALPPLAGVPVGVKDLEDVGGFVTSYGSALFADSPPAETDSILVERLRLAGCVVVGKTNTPEFGWKADTENTTFGSTKNPWNFERSAGGSSGGSAAAVAAGMVPLATGSDGGGSIRIPSAVCGLPGFKPSTGRIPVGGSQPPHWPDISVKGILGNSVRDVVTALDLVVSPDASDLSSLPKPVRSWMGALDDLSLPRKMLWSPTLGYAPVDQEVLSICEAAVEKIAATGVQVEVVDDVFDQDPVGAFLALSGAGNLRLMSKFRDTPIWEKVDTELAAVLEFAAAMSAEDLERNRTVGHLLNLRLVELFREPRFLLTPTVAGQTGPAGGVGTVNGEPDMNWVRFTYPFNLTRSPAGSIPVGFTADGMPVGLQIVGPQRADVAVLRAMNVLENLLAVDHVAPV